MRPLPLRVRVLTALELAPMSLRSLSTALDANQVSVQHTIDDMRKLGVVEKCGECAQRGRDGRRWNVYRIAA